MKVSSSAVSLNVEDAAASSLFLQQHFGFREEMAAEGFASLTRDDVGMNVVFLRRGLPTLPDAGSPGLAPIPVAPDPAVLPAEQKIL